MYILLILFCDVTLVADALNGTIHVLYILRAKNKNFPTMRSICFTHSVDSDGGVLLGFILLASVPYFISDAGYG